MSNLVDSVLAGRPDDGLSLRQFLMCSALAFHGRDTAITGEIDIEADYRVIDEWIAGLREAPIFDMDTDGHLFAVAEHREFVGVVGGEVRFRVAEPDEPDWYGVWQRPEADPC